MSELTKQNKTHKNLSIPLAVSLDICLSMFTKTLLFSRLLIGNELDLNLKFKYCLERLKLRMEETQPFYLIYSGVDAERPDAIDDEIRRRFFVEDSSKVLKFNFRAFKDFLLEEIRGCVDVVMRSKRGEWGLEQKTTNKDFEDGNFKCTNATDCGENR